MKTKSFSMQVVLGIVLLFCGTRCFADNKAITVAVLPCEAEGEWAAKIAELLVEELSAQPGVILVERQEFGRITWELRLQAMHDSTSQLKIGNLLSASLL